MKRIKLTQGKHSLVDDNMFEYLNQFKWYAGKRGNNFYAFRNYDSRNIRSMLLHHLVIGFPLHGKEVDHINCNGLDNRRCNLRIVHRRMNQANRKEKSKATSKYLGVSWHTQSRKWVASIMFKKKDYYLGEFKNEKDASIAYMDFLNRAERPAGGE